MINHLLHPFVLLAGEPRPAPTRMRVFAEDELDAALPPLVARSLRAGVAALRDCGFTLSCYAGITSTQALTTAAALLERDDGAAISFVYAGVGTTTQITVMTAFQTKLSDGTELATANSTSTARTPSRPHVVGVAFPDVTDLAALWAIHAFRIKDAAPTMPQRMSRGSDPVGYQMAEDEEVQDYWIKKGYYSRGSDARLVMTFTGACRAAWRGLWPWKQISARTQARNAAAVHRRMRSPG